MSETIATLALVSELNEYVPILLKLIWIMFSVAFQKWERLY
jgi:hypothetical protein